MGSAIKLRRGVGVAWSGAAAGIAAATTTTALVCAVGAEQRLATSPEQDDAQDDAQNCRSSTQNHGSSKEVSYKATRR